jgi:hypothetical protein
MTEKLSVVPAPGSAVGGAFGTGGVGSGMNPGSESAVATLVIQ